MINVGASSKCLLLFALAAITLHGEAPQPVLSSLQSAINACTNGHNGLHFELTGTISRPGLRDAIPCLITDGTNCLDVGIDWPEGRSVSPGDIVKIGGTIVPTSSGPNRSGANCLDVQTIGHEPPPLGNPVSLDAILCNDNVSRLIRIEGIVRSIWRDELDPLFTFLIVSDRGKTIAAAVMSSANNSKMLEQLPGTRVSLTGSVAQWRGPRHFLGNYLFVSSIRILTPVFRDSTSLPELDQVTIRSTDDLLGLDRHRTDGRVIAVYGGNRFLLKSDSGLLHQVEISQGSLPHYDQHVTAIGFPATDLFTLNLDTATWHLSDHLDSRPKGGKEQSVLEIRKTDVDSSGFALKHIGKAVKCIGFIRDFPRPASDQRLLDCGSFSVLIDASATPAALASLKSGAKAEVTGTYVLNTQNWDFRGVFPRIRNALVAVRTPADVKILKGPPWWTPKRFLSSITFLLAALTVIFCWNIALRRVADRRGHELLKERLAKAKSIFKSEERTRLAVELHDALSQNLTGIAFQLAASINARLANPEAADRHLRTAMNTLCSCRTELGNCLFDLRSTALDETDFTEAIRIVLQPIANNVKIATRFLIPRNQLGDTTAHAVLRIIRELVANAIQHGHAKCVRIAGDISTGALRFSVADNGSGFIPDGSPGPLEGHFGLAGIKERIKTLKGTLTLTSAPGKGTKVTVEIPKPRDEPPQ